MAVMISIILDARRIKKTEKYPLKLRVTFQRETKYYQTNFDLAKKEWDKLSAPRLSAELHLIRDKIKELEQQAKESAQEINPFDFTLFEKHTINSNPAYRTRTKRSIIESAQHELWDYQPFLKKFPILANQLARPGFISYSYGLMIRKLIREGRISSAVNYHCSYVSLMKFGGDVHFSVVTPTYLTEYENWLKGQELSKSTIGIYIRPLRAIFNEAIEANIIKRDSCYPFGKRKYIIPTSKNVKKALELSEVGKIYHYQCDPAQPGEQQARDYWLFSYFANGMNAKDIAKLKFKDYDGEYITFERSKTERCLRSDPRPITIFVNDDMKLIIERWGNSAKVPGNFIFPVLTQGITPLREYELIQNFVGFINEWMKKILCNLGIEKKATTYVARHTFSTVLKRSGASTEFIQEALGHTDMKTTESYLDSFEKEMKKEYAQKLTAFKTGKQT